MTQRESPRMRRVSRNAWSAQNVQPTQSALQIDQKQEGWLVRKMRRITCGVIIRHKYQTSTNRALRPPQSHGRSVLGGCVINIRFSEMTRYSSALASLFVDFLRRRSSIDETVCIVSSMDVAGLISARCTHSTMNECAAPSGRCNKTVCDRHSPSFIRARCGR